MKPARTIPVAVLALAAVATLAVGGPFSRMFDWTSRPEIKWRTDINAAHEEAVLSNRPMLIVFDAKWCSYCEKMNDSTFSDSSLVGYINEAFVPVHLPLEDNDRVASILEVQRIPCTVALSPRADLLGRITGYVNTVQYRETLAKIRALQGRVERKLAMSSR